MKQNPNIAIIGIGRWGKNLTNEFSKRDVNIQAVYSKGDIDNIGWLNENHPDLTLAGSYEEIIGTSGIDAVVIATPIATHYGMARTALLEGKHVFVMKPGANTTKEMRELVELAAEKNKILMVGYTFTYHPACRYLTCVLRTEEVLSINFEWNKWGSFAEDIIHNLFTHELSLLRTWGFVLDEKSMRTSLRGAFGADHLFTLEARTTTGVSVNVNINRLSANKRKAITIVTAQSVYNWIDNDVKVAGADFIEKTVPIVRKSALDFETTELVEAIRNGTNPPTDGKFALDILDTTSYIKAKLLDRQHPRSFQSSRKRLV